jgi:uncharacterized membrane protein
MKVDRFTSVLLGVIALLLLVSLLQSIFVSPRFRQSVAAARSEDSR